MFELKHAYFSYDKKKPLIQDVSFKVEKGEILAILGPNGAGKTTLLKCILGLNKMQKGECLLEEKPIESYGLKLWQEIGYVPQAKNYNASFLVEDMILLGRNIHIGTMKQPKASDYQLVYEKMEYLGISKLKGKTCNRISGGELQMVLLARTLVSNPKMLVLDEPESNLDYYNQLTVLETMQKLAKQGLTCIFNTHYPDHALKIADKSLMMKNGKTVSFGQGVINEQNMKEVFDVNTHISNIDVNGHTHSNVICLSKSDNGIK